MKDAERILEQIDRSWRGPAWHGPSVQEVLRGVDAARAAARPLPGRHSIWENVLHMTTWKEAVCIRATGGDWEPGPEDDWPSVPETSEAAWQKALGRLEGAQQALRDLVAVLDDGRLDEVAPGREHTIGFMLHGVVQHDLYHAGQIAMLREAGRSA